jgi:hypothetical protein
MSLDTGETVILAEPDHSFDPAQIAKAVEAAGFSAGKVKVDVKGTLERVENALALRVPSLDMLILLEGDKASDELEKLDNDTEVSVSGVFHAPEGDKAPRLTVDDVR